MGIKIVKDLCDDIKDQLEFLLEKGRIGMEVWPITPMQGNESSSIDSFALNTTKCFSSSHSGFEVKFEWNEPRKKTKESPSKKDLHRKSSLGLKQRLPLKNNSKLEKTPVQRNPYIR